MSGSIRSSTTRSGFVFSAFCNASAPSRAISTVYRAFFRYIETNDAMFRSSSTMRIFSATGYRLAKRSEEHSARTRETAPDYRLKLRPPDGIARHPLEFSR